MPNRNRLARINDDLATTQNAPTNLSLNQVANEANVLANRILSNVRTTLKRRPDAVRAAQQLRMHVREMNKAAARGNAAGVRRHSREALPFALVGSRDSRFDA